MRHRETNEVLITRALMYPNDPKKRAAFERALTRAKPKPVAQSFRERIEREIWGVGSLSPSKEQIEREIDRSAPERG